MTRSVAKVKLKTVTMTSRHIILSKLYFVLTLIIFTTEAQEKNCENKPCVLIDSCQPMMDVLSQLSAPVPAHIKDFLEPYFCGFEGDKHKVCCPSEPIIIPPLINQKIREKLEPPIVSRHRNFNLLPTNCGHFDTNNRIVHGNKTKLFEFPWMVLLSYKYAQGSAFKCGGTIINERYILTAAHCLVHLEVPLTGVRIGEYDIRTPKDCEEKFCVSYQDLPIEKIIPHPDYDKNLMINDIGLLRVPLMNLSQENTKPVCLPVDKARNFNFAEKNTVVTGWGATENGTSSPELLKAELPIVPLEECQAIFKNNNNLDITHLQLCAGGNTTQSDSCRGDSGGPLQVVDVLYDDQRYVQQGVVSFGPLFCGVSDLPGVYTRVAYYMDWILDNISS